MAPAEPSGLAGVFIKKAFVLAAISEGKGVNCGVDDVTSKLPETIA